MNPFPLNNNASYPPTNHNLPPPQQVPHGLSQQPQSNQSTSFESRPPQQQQQFQPLQQGQFQQPPLSQSGPFQPSQSSQQSQQQLQQQKQQFQPKSQPQQPQPKIQQSTQPHPQPLSPFPITNHRPTSSSTSTLSFEHDPALPTSPQQSEVFFNRQAERLATLFASLQSNIAKMEVDMSDIQSTASGHSLQSVNSVNSVELLNKLERATNSTIPAMVSRLDTIQQELQSISASEQQNIIKGSGLGTLVKGIQNNKNQTPSSQSSLSQFTPSQLNQLDQPSLYQSSIKLPNQSEQIQKQLNDNEKLKLNEDNEKLKGLLLEKEKEIEALKLALISSTPTSYPSKQDLAQNTNPTTTIAPNSINNDDQCNIDNSMKQITIEQYTQFIAQEQVIKEQKDKLIAQMDEIGNQTFLINQQKDQIQIHQGNIMVLNNALEIKDNEVKTQVTQIADQEGKIGDLEQTIGVLKMEKGQMENKMIEDRMLSLQTIQNTIHNNEQHMNHLNLKLTSFSSHNDELKMEVTQLQEQLQGLQNLEEDKVQLNNQCQRLTDDKNVLLQQLRQVEDDKVQLIGQVQQLNEDKNQLLQQLHEDRNQLLQQLQQTTDGKEQMINNLKQLEDDKAHLVSNVKQLEDDQAQLVNNVKQLEDDKIHLVQQSQVLNDDKTQLAQQLQQLNDDKTQLTQQTQILTDDKSQLTQQVNQLNDDKSQLTQQLTQSNDVKFQLDQQVTQLSDDKSTLLQQIQELQQQQQRQQMLNSSSQGDQTTLLEEENQSLKVDIAQLSTHNQALQDHYQALQNNYNDLITQHQSLCDNHAELATQHHSLQSECDRLSTQNQSLLHDYNQLMNDTEALKVQYNDLLVVKDTLQTDYTLLESNNTTIGESFQRLTNDFATIQLELDVVQENYNRIMIENQQLVEKGNYFNDQNNENEAKLMKKCSQLENERDLAMKQVKNLTTTMAQSSSLNAQSTDRVRELDGKVFASTTENDNLKKSLESFKNDTVQEKTRLNDTINQLKAQLDQDGTLIAQLTGEKSYLEARMGAFKEDLARNDNQWGVKLHQKDNEWNEGFIQMQQRHQEQLDDITRSTEAEINRLTALNVDLQERIVSLQQSPQSKQQQDDLERESYGDIELSDDLIHLNVNGLSNAQSPQRTQSQHSLNNSKSISQTPQTTDLSNDSRRSYSEEEYNELKSQYDQITTFQQQQEQQYQEVMDNHQSQFQSLQQQKQSEVDSLRKEHIELMARYEAISQSLLQSSISPIALSNASTLSTSSLNNPAPQEQQQQQPQQPDPKLLKQIDMWKGRATKSKEMLITKANEVQALGIQMNVLVEKIEKLSLINASQNLSLINQSQQPTDLSHHPEDLQRMEQLQVDVDVLLKENEGLQNVITQLQKQQQQNQQFNPPTTSTNHSQLDTAQLSELHELRSDIDTVTTELNHLQGVINKMIQLTEVGDEEQLIPQMTQIIAKLTQLTITIKSRDDEIVQLREEIARLENMVQESGQVGVENQHNIEKIEQMNLENGQNIKKMGEMAQENENYMKMIQNFELLFKEKLSEKDSMIYELQSKVVDEMSHIEEIAALHHKVEEISSQRDALQLSFDSLNDKMASLITSTESSTHEIEQQHQTELDQLMERYKAECDVIRGEFEMRIESLHQEIASLQSDLSSTQSTLNDFSNSSQKYQSLYETTLNERDYLAQELAQLSTEKANLDEQVSETQNKMEQIHHSLSSLQGDYDHIDRLYHTLLNATQQRDAEVEGLRDQNQTLQEDIQSLKSTNSLLIIRSNDASSSTSHSVSSNNSSDDGSVSGTDTVERNVDGLKGLPASLSEPTSSQQHDITSNANNQSDGQLAGGSSDKDDKATTERNDKKREKFVLSSLPISTQKQFMQSMIEALITSNDHTRDIVIDNILDMMDFSPVDRERIKKRQLASLISETEKEFVEKDLQNDREQLVDQLDVIGKGISLLDSAITWWSTPVPESNDVNKDDENKNTDGKDSNSNQEEPTTAAGVAVALTQRWFDFLSNEIDTVVEGDGNNSNSNNAANNQGNNNNPNSASEITPQSDHSSISSAQLSTTNSNDPNPNSSNEGRRDSNSNTTEITNQNTNPLMKGWMDFLLQDVRSVVGHDDDENVGGVDLQKQALVQEEVRGNPFSLSAMSQQAQQAQSSNDNDGYDTISNTLPDHSQLHQQALLQQQQLQQQGIYGGVSYHQSQQSQQQLQSPPQQQQQQQQQIYQLHQHPYQQQRQQPQGLLHGQYPPLQQQQSHHQQQHPVHYHLMSGDDIDTDLDLHA